MKPRRILSGLIVWSAATLFLRIGGERLLYPGSTLRILILFAITFPAMAILVRRVCSGLPPDQWLAGAVSFALPTLLLDPFSSAFFPSAFPNMDPSVAGVFGGWMPWCCAGAFAGVLIGRPKQA